MAKKSKVKQPKEGAVNQRTKPKFPYTTTPNSLRKFLQQAPERPKPPKVNMDTLKAWGIGDSNANSILRVLKDLGLVDASNVPTAEYEGFMKREGGSLVLGKLVKARYALLFGHESNPDKASNAALKNFFNIYSGGGEGSIDFQIATFKVLTEFSRFDGTPSSTVLGDPKEVNFSGSDGSGSSGSRGQIHLDLHIHLPENKTKQEYDSIIESIATHLMKR